MTPKTRERYETENGKRIGLTVDIVTAFVGHNVILWSEVSALIGSTFQSVEALDRRATVQTPALRVPAVPISQSIQPGYLVCLDDGKKLKMLKRHLGKLGMTPDEYRARWGLPKSYPMSSPQHSAHRSKLARSWMLGHSE